MPPRRKTRLQEFLDRETLTSAQLEAATGISRQGMTKIRAGQDLRLRTMRRILDGARRLTGRNVRMEELFDLEPEGQAKTS